MTTLAFVRTGSGVVRVEKGGQVPDGALEAEVERLVRAGVIVGGDAGAGDGDADDGAAENSGEVPGGGGDPAPVWGTPRGAKQRGGRSEGKAS